MTNETNTSSATEVLHNTSFPSVVGTIPAFPQDKPYLKIEKNTKGYNWELKGIKGDLMTQEDIDLILAQKDYISQRLME